MKTCLNILALSWPAKSVAAAARCDEAAGHAFGLSIGYGGQTRVVILHTMASG